MTILPHSTELLAPVADLHGEDQARAHTLAKALGGRWVPVAGGYAFRPSAARRFLGLFDTGYTAAMRGGVWVFRREGRRWISYYGALKQVRKSGEAVCLR